MNAGREVAAFAGSVAALVGVGMLSVPAMLIIGGVFLMFVAVRSGRPPAAAPAAPEESEET